LAEDEERLKDHPVKLYEALVLYVRSVVNEVGFPIRHVNRFMAVCTKIIIDDYQNGDEKKKKQLKEKIKENEQNLIDEKYLPDLDKEKKK
jgi:hypothetical protein